MYLIKEVERHVFTLLYQNWRIYIYLGAEKFLHYFSSLWFPCSCNRLDLKCLPLGITSACSSLKMRKDKPILYYTNDDIINFYGVKDLLHTAAEASFPSCASWIPRLWCMPMKCAAGVGLLVETACQLWAGLYMLCLVNLKPCHQNSERERSQLCVKKKPNYLHAVEICPSQLWKIMHIWHKIPTTRI